MADPAVVPPSSGVEEVRPGPIGLVMAAFGYLNWLITLPFVLAHEGAHAAACLVLGVGLKGAGYSYDSVYLVGDRRLPRIYSAFMMHEPVDGRKGVVISLAPGLLIVPALSPSLPLTVRAFFLLSGLTVVSDVLSIAIPEFASENSGAGFRFLVGGPDQVQTGLGEYL